MSVRVGVSGCEWVCECMNVRGDESVCVYLHLCVCHSCARRRHQIIR